jgi:hypothetical protein
MPLSARSQHNWGLSPDFCGREAAIEGGREVTENGRRGDGYRTAWRSRILDVAKAWRGVIARRLPDWLCWLAAAIVMCEGVGLKKRMRRQR